MMWSDAINQLQRQRTSHACRLSNTVASQGLYSFRKVQLPAAALENRKASGIRDTKPLPGFNYNAYWMKALKEKQENKSYRRFQRINKLVAEYPFARIQATDKSEKLVNVWSSSDHLGMARHPLAIEAMTEALQIYGCSSGGSHNMSGHNQVTDELEGTLSRLHGKGASLVFTSGFVANEETLRTLAVLLPDLVFLSDEENHASIISGIRKSGAAKVIWRHNDLDDLERRLQAIRFGTPKVIVFESIYSMTGSVAHVKEILNLAERYGAITFADESHAVGMYGPHGGGLLEHLDYDIHSLNPPPATATVRDRVDIISASLSKAIGSFGGYIAGTSTFVDAVRSFSPGFIFTSSLPPAVMAGAKSAIDYLSTSSKERCWLQLNCRDLKALLISKGIPIIPSPTHIVSVLIGDAERASCLTEILLQEYGHYVQSVNYPSVRVGTERLRITPMAEHTKEQLLHLGDSLDKAWSIIGLPRVSEWTGPDSPLNTGTTSDLPSMWTSTQLNECSC